MFSNNHHQPFKPETSFLIVPAKEVEKKKKNKVRKMRASMRLLWKLSVIVLVAAVSQADISQPSISRLKNCSADDGSLDGTEVGNRREAAELQPQPEEGKGPGKGGAMAEEKGQGKGGAMAEGPEMNWPGKWELFLKNSGVSAMHAILMPLINKVQVYDATIWRISQIKLPPGVPCHLYNPKTNQVDCWAHSVLVDIETGNIKPLAVIKLLLSLFQNIKSYSHTKFLYTTQVYLSNYTLQYYEKLKNI